MLWTNVSSLGSHDAPPNPIGRVQAMAGYGTGPDRRWVATSVTSGPSSGGGVYVLDDDGDLQGSATFAATGALATNLVGLSVQVHDIGPGGTPVITPGFRGLGGPQRGAREHLRVRFERCAVPRWSLD